MEDATGGGLQRGLGGSGHEEYLVWSVGVEYLLETGWAAAAESSGGMGAYFSDKDFGDGAGATEHLVTVQGPDSHGVARRGSDGPS